MSICLLAWASFSTLTSTLTDKPSLTSAHGSRWSELLTQVMSQLSYVQFASQQTAINRVEVAFVVVLLYDHALTLGEEVEYIWKQKMNIGKLLFFLNRYIPMIDQLILVNANVNTEIQDNKVCLALFQVNNWMSIFSTIVIDVMMLLRTWALWERSRVVLIFLSVLLVVCILASSGSLLYFSLTVFAIPNISTISPCDVAFPRPDFLYIIWVSLSVFDSAIMIMTLIKILPALQSNVPMPLRAQFLKDGIPYFIMIFFASLANIIMIRAAPGILRTMLIPSYPVIISTLGSRLVLNLRGSLLCQADDEEQTAIKLDTLVFGGEMEIQQHQ
ncbi:hypothetical protein PILCRDRAFT_827122 [Piloderma croceum F 1598]|uniref:DUF6533 domain-containing protein n=1 Tax=Piloderma croceum (strain F 1598) TaxID=765440 RepID=A0A0C3ESL9_PILCF|nr:hypothetical protein PILCRDRAFT_827122 [Piloderma croceum F 1598]